MFINKPPLKNGFTLLELLVVLGIVGLLSSMAMPIYHQSQQRGQRSLAKVALLQVAHWMERAASAQGQYPGESAVPTNLLSPTGLHYQISLTSSEQVFVITAQPIGPQTTDPCGILTLSNSGERGVKDTILSATQCWSR